MRAELCKTCAHMEVCGRDKNIVGDVYVPPNPIFFDGEYRKNAWESFKKREAEGFPCDAYSPSNDTVEVVHGKWIEKDDVIITGTCSVCGWDAIFAETDVTGMPYCPNCGARMDEVTA